MGKSYEGWQSWQQFGSTGNIPKANESTFFIQCFLTFPQSARSQIVHFLSRDKIFQACHKYRCCNCQPWAVRLKKGDTSVFFFFFSLKMALVTSWLLSKMNSVTMPILCTRQWKARIRFQMCPTYVSKYCNTDNTLVPCIPRILNFFLGLPFTLFMLLFISIPFHLHLGQKGKKASHKN